MSKLEKDIGMAKKCDHSNAVALLEPSIDDVRCVTIVCCDCDFKIKTSNVYRAIFRAEKVASNDYNKNEIDKAFEDALEKGRGSLLIKYVDGDRKIFL